MRYNGVQLCFDGFTLDDFEREAISFLREHEPPEGYFVGFSGGKDSIVTLQLVRMSGVKHTPFYTCTRIDPPEMYRFIKAHYPEIQWLYPKMTLWEGIRKKSPPLRMQRWCCDVLKKDPAKHIPLKNRVMGIRAEESTRRASRPRIDDFKKYGQKIYKPIFAWKEWQVWEFIEKYSLPYPSLYDEGFHRIGCVVCPFILGTSSGKVRERTLSMQRWPGMWKALRHAVMDFYELKRRGRDWEKYRDAECFYQAYLNGFENKEKWKCNTNSKATTPNLLTP